MPKRGHFTNKEKCVLFHFESYFRSWDNQILTFQIFKCHDVIKCISMKYAGVTQTEVEVGHRVWDLWVCDPKLPNSVKMYMIQINKKPKTRSKKEEENKVNSYKSFFNIINNIIFIVIISLDWREQLLYILLTLSWRGPLSYRNQSTG